MKGNEKLICAVSITIASLAGCVTIPAGPVSNSQNNQSVKASKQSDDVALYRKAIDSNSVTTIAELGLLNPKTVWVPWRYRPDGKSALYIKGRQFVTKEGYNDVAGFIKGNDGNYVVAVIQPVPASDKTTYQLRYVMYRVSPDGEILGEIAKIEGSDLVVAKNGLFVERPQVSKDGYKGALSDYIGVDPEGKTILGPQGAWYAAPLPDGGWFVQRRTSLDSIGYAHWQYERIGPNGEFSVIAKDKKYSQEINRYVRTTAVFVDTPNYADSARTGRAVKLWREYTTLLTSDLWDVRVVAVNLIDYDINRRGVMSISVGSGRNISLEDGVELAGRTIIFGDQSKAYFASQYSYGFSSPAYGYAHLINDSQMSAVFELVGSAGNVLRILGGNTILRNAANDAYGIVGPKGTVLVAANPIITDKHGNEAYFIEDQKAIKPKEIEGFLARFGINKQ